MDNYNTDISNILVIGCGGAGLRAAIEVKTNNLCVKILGKRVKTDAHTVLAAGGINAAFANLDSDDSWQQHFVDTFLEGYEIGDPETIELMAKNALERVIEIDKWGANFEKLDNGKLDQRFFGAHTYRRTCYSGDYTGQSILNALLEKANKINVPIFDEQYVTDLLIEDNQCFGAMSFNIKNGERTIHFADAVILATGGHTRLWKKSSSRNQENMGDGIDLALKAGCNLIDMEMVQFHPTGILYPEEYSGMLVTEAVRGEGGRLFNNKGERFMENYDKQRMELSTRDKVAIANYKEIKEGRATPNGGVYLDISHKDKDFILKKIPKIYRQFIELQMVDISKEPMEVAPTAHYSMGGILVDAKNHKTNVEGLFCAGEVVGGLHGANRLGGNSLAEILVFGKITGESASAFSKNLNYQLRSKKPIKIAHENINKFIRRGDYLPIPLINNLRNIMWEYCGVVKDEKLLEKGLNEINNLKESINNVDVRIERNNFSDLINILDLNSAIISSEATIKSCIFRKESRGAHFRSDFPLLDPKFKFNIKIQMKKNSLFLSKYNHINLKEEIYEYLNKSIPIDNLKGKLLE